MANGRTKTASFGPAFLGAVVLFCAFAVAAWILFRFVAPAQTYEEKRAQDRRDKVAAIDEANYVVLTAGSFDIIAELLAVDDDDLVHLLNDSVRSIPGVTEVETFLYLKLAKQTFSWGTK